MQDSLEDYIRITRNCKEGPTQVKNDVLLNAQIQQECDAKAMQILQFAIEGKMRSDALFRCLPHINQSHYQDIVEERSISKLCGYPLCSRRIPDMPKKQFYISTKNNKVYDITDRKNYCSNFCYRASIHIKGQIDTSPLWLRKHNEKAHFTLLNKSEKGLPGEIVDQGIIKPVMEPVFTSISNFTQMSLDEAEELELNPQEEEESKKQLKKPKKFQKSAMKTINENDEEDQIESDFKKDSNNEIDAKVVEQTETDINKHSSDKKDVEVSTKLVMDEDTEMGAKLSTNFNISEKVKTGSMPKVKEKPAISQSASEIDIESHLSKCFKEWLTLETYMFIYGEENVKKKLDCETVSDYFDSLKIADLQVEQQKRYVDICRKLQLKEVADEKFDKSVVGNQALNPLPDYHQLKEENRDLNLKVKSFYGGEVYIKEDSNFPVKKKENESTNEDDGPPAVLPLVDGKSQNALRRKIFLTPLNKTVQNLFQTLRMNSSLVLSDLQALVKTFQLKANNIVFKPALWNYIAIILLRILSLKDENTRDILDKSADQLNLWMSSLPHKNQLMDEVLNTLSDIDTFVKDYIICK